MNIEVLEEVDYNLLWLIKQNKHKSSYYFQVIVFIYYIIHYRYSIHFI